MCQSSLFCPNQSRGGGSELFGFLLRTGRHLGEEIRNATWLVGREQITLRPIVNYRRKTGYRYNINYTTAITALVGDRVLFALLIQLRPAVFR